MLFELDYRLLSEAKTILQDNDSIFWIIGGAGTGKSTVCRELVSKFDAALYDMDEHVFGSYMGRYRADRHPVSTAWFTQQDSLAWSLSLSPEEFNALYRAANAEHISLFAEDMRQADSRERVIVDGGITHPSVLARVVPVKRILCLDAAKELLAKTWDSTDERLSMKRAVLRLPEGATKWKKFLEFDRLLTNVTIEESQEENIRIFHRLGKVSIENFSSQIADCFGWA